MRAAVSWPAGNTNKLKQAYGMEIRHDRDACEQSNIIRHGDRRVDV